MVKSDTIQPNLDSHSARKGAGASTVQLLMQAAPLEPQQPNSPQAKPEAACSLPYLNPRCNELNMFFNIKN